MTVALRGFAELTPTGARRLADIADALEPIGAVALEPLSNYVPAEVCSYCGWQLEAGWCYTCHPVFGYGEGRLPRPSSRAVQAAERRQA